jgi:hypothetical protein
MGKALLILSGKWKLKILWHLSKGTIRFNELQRLLGSITTKTLTEQLRELEEIGSKVSTDPTIILFLEKTLDAMAEARRISRDPDVKGYSSMEDLNPPHSTG